jgi:hypothetical protein
MTDCEPPVKVGHVTASDIARPVAFAIADLGKEGEGGNVGEPQDSAQSLRWPTGLPRAKRPLLGLVRTSSFPVLDARRTSPLP